MVSRITKKPKPRTPKKASEFGRRRKKSPIKSVAAVSSLIETCHRHLVKIFSKLARIGTPTPKKIKTKKKNKSPKKIGYEILPKLSSPCRNLFPNLLPPPVSVERKTLFLDLDETLIHSEAEAPSSYDFVVKPVIDGVVMDFYVKKRPFVDEFLEFVAKRFELVVFTAGLEEYACLVIDELDRKGLISHRLYRGSCKEVDGKLVKDLGDAGRDLGKVAIIDDNPNAYSLQLRNAIPVKAFVDDMEDTELKRLMGLLEGCDEVEDMRDFAKICQEK